MQGPGRYRQGSGWEGARIYALLKQETQPVLTIKQVGHVRPYHPMFYLGKSYQIWMKSRILQSNHVKSVGNLAYHEV